MSIFSAIRAGVSRIKSAVSAGVSRVRSAITGAGRQAQQSVRSSTTTVQTVQDIRDAIDSGTGAGTSFDDLRAPTAREIRDSHWRFQVNHADSDLSGYARSDVDRFYASTKKIWEGVPVYDRNDVIREYFEENYGLSEMSDIWDFVINGQVPDTDSMVNSDALDDSGELYRLPVINFG